MNSFKDLFSAQAQDYSKFRPRYPAELFQWLAENSPSREAAWDCGTGNGQAAVELAKLFKHVFATDPSEKQLQAAERRENISYLAGTAERAPLGNGSADLITVAQAYHWFKHPLFFEEVRRIGKEKALVAVWSYALAQIDPEVDTAVLKLHNEILAGSWEKERDHVANGYRDLPFPFARVSAPDFYMSAEWSFGHLIGYLGTWSAVQDYRKKKGSDPVELIAPELKRAWPGDDVKPVRWKLTFLAGRL